MRSSRERVYEVERQATRTTVARPVARDGVGIHSGEKARLTVAPAASGHGVRFLCRGRDDARHEVVALHRSLHATTQATTLSTDPGAAAPRASVATVEHLLAALWATGIDDALLVIDGPELPVLDGSAAPFCALLEEAGRVEHAGARCVLGLREPIEIVDGARRIRAEPASRLSIDYRIDFPHPAIGQQRHRCDCVDAAWFARELASARTFGFLSEVEAMREAGLALGGSLDNTIVLGEHGVLNPEGLRFPDEFVRHKVIDLLGDLALLGAPLRARIVAERAGHALHQRLVAALLGV